MTTHSGHNGAIRLPAMQIGAISLGACVLIATIGGVLSLQRDGSLGDGLNALIATVPGVLVCVGVLGMLPPREAGQWSFPVLAMTMLRALVTLSLGFGVHALISPDRVVFFLTLLVSLLTVLGIDVACVISLVQKHAPMVASACEPEGVCR